MLNYHLDKRKLILVWKKKESFWTRQFLLASLCSLCLHAFFFGFFKARSSPMEESPFSLKPIAVSVDLKIQEMVSSCRQTGFQFTFLDSSAEPEIKSYSPIPHLIREKIGHEDFIDLEDMDMDYDDRD